MMNKEVLLQELEALAGQNKNARRRR